MLIICIAICMLCVPFVVEGGTTSFTSPGSYDFTVPFGVTSLSVTISGASGSDSTFGGATSLAGLGMKLTVTVPVTPSKFCHLWFDSSLCDRFRLISYWFNPLL